MAVALIVEIDRERVARRRRLRYVDRMTDSIDETLRWRRRGEEARTTDTDNGIMRHSETGYPERIDAARRHALDLPGVPRCTECS